MFFTFFNVSLLVVVAGLAVAVGWLVFRSRKAGRALALCQAELARERSLWNRVHQTLPLQFFVKMPDQDFRYQFCNRALERFYQKPSGFFVNKNDFDFLPQGVAERRRAEEIEVMKSNPDVGVLSTIDAADPNGELHHMKIFQYPCRDADGRRLLIGYSIDVTELVAMQNELKKLNSRLTGNLAFYENLFDAIPAYISARDIDDKMTYVYCNRYFCEGCGFKKSEVIGKNDRELFASQPNFQLGAAWDREAIRSGKPQHQVVAFIEPDGKARTLDVHWLPTRQTDGHYWLFQVANDVTALNEARSEAKRSADWLRLTFNSIGDGVLTTDADGRIEMMNPVAERMLGITAAEAFGQPHEKYFNIVSYLDERPMNSVVTRALRTGSVVELANHTDLISRDGKRYHISDSAAPIRGANGVIVGAILVFHDVTEEYMQRDRLRDALFLMEFGSEQTHSATFRLEVATHRITGSKLLGTLLPIAGGVVKDYTDFVDKEDQVLFSAKLQDVLQHRSAIASWVYRSSFSGERRWYRLATSAIWTAPGTPSFFGVIQDITEIIRLSDQVKGSQNLFRQVVNSIPVIIFAKDIDQNFRYVICNPQCADFIGLKQDEIIGRTDEELFSNELQSETAKSFRERDLEVVKGGKPLTYLEEPRNRQGMALHFQTTKMPVMGANGERLLLGISTDITELTSLVSSTEVVNEVLRQVVIETDFSQNLDQLAQTIRRQIDPDRLIVVRLGTDEKFHFYREWSSVRVKPIAAADYSRHEFVWAQFLPQMRANAFVHFSDITTEIPSMRKVLDAHPDYETRALMGAPIFIQGELWGVLLVSFAWIRPILPSDERFMRSMANILALARIRDRQSEALKIADAERQKILDNIDIPVTLYDEQARIVRMNQLVTNQLGLTNKEMIGHTCERYFGCTAADQANCPIQMAIRTGQPQVRFHRRNNMEYYIHARPIFDDHGKVVNVIRTAFDVTDINRLMKNEQVIGHCFQTLLEEADLQRGIHSVLEAIAQRVGATRSYIMRFDTAHRTLTCVREYVEPGRHPFYQDFQDRPYSTKPDWEELFQKASMIEMPQGEIDAPRFGLGPEWIAQIRKFGVHSYYARRIMLHGVFWGYIGLVFENQPHPLQGWERSFIESVAHIISVMVQYMAIQQQIRDALAVAKRANAEKTVSLENAQVLNQSLRLLFEEADTSRTLKKLIAMLAQHYRARLSFVLRYDFERRQNWVDLVYAPGEQQIRAETLARHTIEEHVAWYRSMQRHEHYNIPDIESPEGQAAISDWYPVMHQLHLKSVYCYPIFCQNRLWGNLAMVYGPENARVLGEADLQMLEILAHTLEIMLGRQAADEQVRKALEKAQAADKAKSFFIASVSHEIRTPLNAVIGFTELLKDASLTPEVRQDYLDSISYSSDALLQLINDVLDLSKLEAGQMTILTEALNPVEIGNDILRVFSFRAKEKSLALHFEHGEIPVLELDRLRVRQILFNLIGNAIKFTEQGCVTLRASFAKNGEEEGAFSLAVQDTGIGISKENQAKLMEPFVQLPGIRGSNAGANGTGLGLAISRRLAEKMGGKLWVKSELGKGSTFGMTLPHVRIARQASIGQSDLTMAASGTDPVMALPEMSILLVDDVKMNLKVMGAICRKIGIRRVTCVSSGAEALKALEQEHFRLVLTDLWMPGMSGLELAKRIHADARFAHLPLVAVTADVEAKGNFAMTDFLAVLQKPITTEKLKGMFEWIARS